MFFRLFALKTECFNKKLHFSVTFLIQRTSYKKPNLPMELSESIIDRLQHGEKQLFGQLIEMYQDRVYGLSFQLMKNEDDANEVVQNTFIKVLLSFQYGFTALLTTKQ